MSLLAERFAAIREEKRCGFIPFVVAGEPDLASAPEILRALSEVDPVAIEVGVPFSDPTADGPVIQRAAQRAIERGTNLGAILQTLRAFRGAPLVLFSYYNPVLQFGFEKFARALPACGVAGVLIVDLPAEAAAPLRAELRKRDVDLILLVAPTTSDRRLAQIAEQASGFIYAVARPGVTGNARELADESEELVVRVREVTDLPVAVGFGIAKREHARRVCRYADAAVVGSRIVADIASAGPKRTEVLRAVRRCAREFAL